MNGVPERPIVVRILTLLAVLSILPSPAIGGSCGQVFLKNASGVIGMAHGYTFSAVCSWSYTESKDSFSLSGFSSTSTNYGIDMEVLGKGKWDRKTGKAQEDLSVKGYGAVKGPSGSFAGKRVATGICNQDPFLKDPPGAAAVCNSMNVQYVGTSGPIFNVMITPKQFLLARKISLVEAQALSAKQTSSTPPPPPAPKPQPKKPPVTIEGSHAAQGGMKASPGQAAAVVAPNLLVVRHQAIVEPNCQPPKPAMTVRLVIRNSGGPLPPNKGTVYMKEFGGANLSSGGVSLPALNPGQQHAVDLPVLSLKPYSSLPGVHPLQVMFAPQVDGGKPAFRHPSPPFTVMASFPPDHCKAVSRPAPGGGNAAGTRGVQPVPPPPVPSRLKNR